MENRREAGWGNGLATLLIAVATIAAAVVVVRLIFATPPSGRTSPTTVTAVTPAPETVRVSGVYTAKLTTGTRPDEFSAGTVAPTRRRRRPLLGRYGPEGVRFALPDLPPHEAVHVVMDLALVNSWNGSSPIWGPDVWSCQDADGRGRQLFATTFCNCGFFSNNNEQSFPDVFPTPDGAVLHPGWTGAAEQQTLGEDRPFKDSAGTALREDCSSVYHLDWTFPHQQPELNLQFKEHLTHGGNPRIMFGFLSFHAECVRSLATLTDAERTTAWNDLGRDDDPVAANAAVWKLASGGDGIVPFLRERLALPESSPVSPYRPSRIDHLLQVIATPAADALRAAPQTIR